MFQTKSVVVKISGKVTLEALAHYAGNGFKATMEAASKSIEAGVSGWLSFSLEERTNKLLRLVSHVTLFHYWRPLREPGCYITQRFGLRSRTERKHGSRQKHQTQQGSRSDRQSASEWTRVVAGAFRATPIRELEAETYTPPLDVYCGELRAGQIRRNTPPKLGR
jgi:hypothetical protein